MQRKQWLFGMLLMALVLVLPLAVSAQDGDGYIVQPGDTLGAIATRFGVGSYMQIVELTNARHGADPSYAYIENPNLIRVGWKLALPGSVSGSLMEAAEAVDIAVSQTENLAALDVLDLIAPSEAALASLPQGTIDLIQDQIPAMYEAMVGSLKDLAEFTAFVPTGSAWTRLSVEQLESLATDPALRDSVWRNHVVSGTYMAADLTDGLTLPALGGHTIVVSRAGEQVSVDGLAVRLADVQPPSGQIAARGTLHVIDGILTISPAQPGVDSYTVVGGDTLYWIAARLLGDGARYMEIVEATNAAGGEYAFIENPNLIEIGWLLAIPGR